MNPADPLAALRDIHLPPEPPIWPPAPGWWLLALAVLAACVALAITWQRARARNAGRRAAALAVRELDRRHAAGEPAHVLACELNALLKRYVLTRYRAEEVAGLAGERWADFLEHGRGGSAFGGGLGARLARAPYARRSVAEEELTALLWHCERWILNNPPPPGREPATSPMPPNTSPHHGSAR